MSRAGLAAVALLQAVLALGTAPPSRAERAVAAAQLIQDATLRARVQTQLAQQRELAQGRQTALFGVLERRLAPEEREALEFLFAFMPLSDLADYDGEYFLGLVRATLEARRTMPWGARIPTDIFLHYVLPHRVNTENLDDARPVLFAQLKDRVRTLALGDAVLEVNHWCHERVTYRPSDMRTSGPLATIRTSWGRCGEESTLVVAALRAVGIPARQVYTPRWAHVDDNHAWVEAWVDGRWRYLGACEPAPALDMAWFREPARRAMMIHTKVMGGAGAGEDKVQSNRWSDEINVLAAYAPTVTRSVKVLDGEGRPVEGAAVEFGLYNYAEFYPLATMRTGADGVATLTSGKGALRIWASKGDLVGRSVLAREDNETTVILGPFDPAERVEDQDLSPPVAPPAEPVAVSAAAQETNTRRLAEEDRLREAYAATFMSQADSGKLARTLRLDAGALWPLMQKSQGNWREIAKFLRETRGPRRTWALALLGAITDKDLRDTPAAVLADHLEHAFISGREPAPPDRALFVEAVLSPRIAHELLRPWRGRLQRELGRPFLDRVREDPSVAVAWVRRSILIDDEANYYRTPTSPVGVYEIRVADPLSRDIFFVALCRAAGAPARIEPATSRPQFHQGGGWKTVAWDDQPPVAAPVGRLALALASKGATQPEYSTHFSLARFANHRYETLDFEGRPWSFFEQPFEASAGDYVLTTGARLADGTVLARQRFFQLKAGETRTLPLEIRTTAGAPAVLGRIEMGGGLADLGDGRALDLARLAGGQGLVLAWIGRGDEPTNHVLGDLARLKEDFERWGGGLVLVLTQGPGGGARTIPEATPLARQTTVAVDDGGALLAKALAAIGRPSSPVRLPVLLGVNPGGEVAFVSEGYSIGAGERALQTLPRGRQ